MTEIGYGIQLYSGTVLLFTFRVNPLSLTCNQSADDSLMALTIPGNLRPSTYICKSQTRQWTISFVLLPIYTYAQSPFTGTAARGTGSILDQLMDLEHLHRAPDDCLEAGSAEFYTLVIPFGWFAAPPGGSNTFASTHSFAGTSSNYPSSNTNDDTTHVPASHAGGGNVQTDDSDYFVFGMVKNITFNMEAGDINKLTGTLTFEECNDTQVMF